MAGNHPQLLHRPHHVDQAPVLDRFAVLKRMKWFSSAVITLPVAGTPMNSPRWVPVDETTARDFIAVGHHHRCRGATVWKGIVNHFHGLLETIEAVPDTRAWDCDQGRWQRQGHPHGTCRPSRTCS